MPSDFCHPELVERSQTTRRSLYFRGNGLAARLTGVS